jgi:hypothetical protein
MFSFDSLRADGFSCSLGVLYRGLGISKLQFLIKKLKNFSALYFFQFLVIKTLDPELDPDSDPDPQLERMLELEHATLKPKVR